MVRARDADYRARMELSPPQITSQALHRVGRDGSHLGVIIGISSADWRTLDLVFQYSIDEGHSWRPLLRDVEAPRRRWSAVVYGVRSGETVLVRAALGNEIGATAAFTVADGVDAATEHLRGFVPPAPKPPAQPSPSRRRVRRSPNLSSSAYFTTGTSQAYHSSPDCPALRSGQSGVAWRGGSPAGVLSETVTDAIFEGKRPCCVCRPRSA